MFKRLRVVFPLVFFFIMLYSFLVLAQDQNKQNGIKYINEGKYRPAIEELEKVILKNPRDAEALFYLGVAYRNLGSGQLKNALSGISQALKIRPNDPNWQYALAQTYDEMDKYGIFLTDTIKTTYELAVEAYKKVIDLQNKFLEAHLSLGELYLRKGKYELAAEKFKDVIKIDEKNVSSYSYLVDCLCKLERYDEAIKNLSQWSKIDSNKIEPHNLKAKIYWYQSKYEEAQREYQKIIELDPSNQLARARLDTIIVINQNKNRINELYAKGESFVQAGQYNNAIFQFEQILRIDPYHEKANDKLLRTKTRLSDIWFNEGLGKVQSDDLDGAVENYNKALEYAQSKEQMDKIIKSWKDAQLTLGERVQIYELKKIGKKYILEKKYSWAKTYLSVFDRESDVKEDSIKIALDTLGIASLYQAAIENEQKGFWIESLACYREIFKVDSTYKDVRYRIAKVNGDLAYQKKAWREAKVNYEKALQISSSLAKQTEPLDHKSVITKLAEAKSAIQNRDFKSFIRNLLIYSIFVFLGLISGVFLHLKILSSKERRAEILKKIKEFFLKPINYFTVMAAIVLILLSFIYKDQIIDLFLSFDMLLRALIYGFIIILVLTIILGFTPKHTQAVFDIHSNQVRFKFSKKNATETLFGKPMNILGMTIQNIRSLNFYANGAKIQGPNFNKNISGNLNIEPAFGATNLDFDLVRQSDNKYLKLKKVKIPKGLELGLEKQNHALFLKFGSKKSIYSLSDHHSCNIEIGSSIKFSLKRCRIFKENDQEALFNSKLNDSITISIANEDQIQGLHFDIINGATRLEFYFDTVAVKNAVGIFENITGESFDICDQSLYESSGKEKSTLSEDSSIKIQFESPLEVKLKNSEIFKIKASKFTHFDLQMHNKGFQSLFISRIRYLKTGRPIEINSSSNLIPDCLKWIVKYNQKAAILLLLISGFIGFVVNYLIERSKLLN